MYLTKIREPRTTDIRETAGRKLYLCMSTVTSRIIISRFFEGGGCGPTRVMVYSFVRFLDHTQRRNTVSRTPLNE
jgi:hypothetical protein